MGIKKHFLLAIGERLEYAEPEGLLAERGDGGVGLSALLPGPDPLQVHQLAAPPGPPGQQGQSG